MTGGREPAVLHWWDSTPELTMPVACEGQGHRLSWRDGEVVLLDHPELEAELAMVALGGAEPACVLLYRLWGDAVADGGFLAEWVDESRLSATWFSWLAMALERMRSEGFHEFLRGLPPARAQRMGEFLHRFPVPWIDRAAATVSHAASEGSGVVCVHARPLLADAISQRLRRAFVDSIGGRRLPVGAAALVPLAVSVDRADGAVSTDSSVDADQLGGPGLTGRLVGPGRGVRISVAQSWLHRVWAANAAIIDGRLALALADAVPNTGGRAMATLVDWQSMPDGTMHPHIDQVPVVLVDRRWQPA